MNYNDGWNKNILLRRLKKIKEYLFKNDMDAIVILDDNNIKYVSGFFLDVSTWERPIAVVIPVNEEPYMILNEISKFHVDFSLKNNRGYIENILFYSEHVRLTDRIPTIKEFYKLLTSTLENENIINGIIGVDKNMYFLKNEMKKYLSELKIVDAENILREMRLIKTEEEIKLIKKFGELSDWGQHQAAETIQVGLPWIEFCSDVELKICAEAAKRYPEYHIEINAGGFVCGPHTVMPHGPGGFSGRIIQQGDIIINGVWGSFNLYGAENERTFFVGEPTEKQKEIFNIMTKAQEEAIKKCVAGNTVSSIDAAAQKVIEKAGYGDFIMHRTGHGIGIAGHEYWDDMPFNHMKLKAGMVTSIEPGIYVKGIGGVRHSDTVVVGEETPLLMTHYTKNIDDITIKI